MQSTYARLNAEKIASPVTPQALSTPPRQDSFTKPAASAPPAASVPLPSPNVAIKPTKGPASAPPKPQDEDKLQLPPVVKLKSTRQNLTERLERARTLPRMKTGDDPLSALSQVVSGDDEFEHFQDQQKLFLELFADKKQESDARRDKKSEVKVQNLYPFAPVAAAKVLELYQLINAITPQTHAKEPQHRYYDAIIEFLLEINKIPRGTDARKQYFEKDFLEAVNRVLNEDAPVDLKVEIKRMKKIAEKLQRLSSEAKLLAAADKLLCDSKNGGKDIFMELTAGQLAGLGDQRIGYLAGFMQIDENAADSETVNETLVEIQKGFKDAQIGNARGLSYLNSKIIMSIDVLRGRLDRTAKAEEQKQPERKDDFHSKKVAELGEIADPREHERYNDAIQSLVKTHTALMHLERLKTEIEAEESKMKSTLSQHDAFPMLLVSAGRSVLAQSLIDMREMMAGNDLNPVKLDTIATIAERTTQAVSNPTRDTFANVFEYSAEAQTFSHNHISAGLKKAAAVLAITALLILSIAMAPATVGASLKLGATLAVSVIAAIGLLYVGISTRQTHKAKLQERASKYSGVALALNLFGPRTQMHSLLPEPKVEVLTSPRITGKQ